MKKSNKILGLENTSVTLGNLIHIIMTVLAIAVLYFAIRSDQAVLTERLGATDRKADRLEAKMDSALQRLSRIEGALNIKSPVSTDFPKEDETTVSQRTPFSPNITVNAQEESGSSARIANPQPQPTPNPGPGQEIQESAKDIACNSLGVCL